MQSIDMEFVQNLTPLHRKSATVQQGLLIQKSSSKYALLKNHGAH